MNKRKITLLACLMAAMLPVMAQPVPQEEGHGEAPHHEGCQMMLPTVDFKSVKISYAPHVAAFVAIDSAECSIHLIRQVGERLDTTASYRTDETYKRHDLGNIMRPVSVGFIGRNVVLLASAVNDTSYVALLDGDLNVVARRDFGCSMYATHFEHGQLMVVGSNKYGYDIEVIPMHNGIEAFEKGPTLASHYRVAKQSEKILHSDPAGIGLTAVAVSVVFLALVFIFLILQGEGGLIMGMEKRRKNKGVDNKPATAKGGDKENEVIAAIAAAIHLYNEELHDEESTIITIQKVEREWTPWNAKYYNMNHYFNNRK